MNVMRLIAWAIIGGILATGLAVGFLAALSTCGYGF